MLDIKDNYCPLPWTSLYHQLGTNSPCHCVRGFTLMSPNEYTQSEQRLSLKNSFEKNEFPSACHMCPSREKMGLKSTRKEAIRFFNETYNVEKFKVEDDIKFLRFELRFSNLCNYKCRMCEPYSSSEIAKEMLANGEISGNTVIRSSQQDIEELKALSHNLRSLCLTGGEPFLIKEYYDFLDYLIEQDLASNIEVEIFTNCSVYNDKLISKLMKFKSVRFVVSIDGVGKTAEYIRHGCDWKTVRENALKFAKLPFNFYFNTAISQYTLLDVSNLAKFLIELYEVNNTIKTKCYSVIAPADLHFMNMPIHHRAKAFSEIDEAVRILTPSNFDIFNKEILGMKENISSRDPVDPDAYVRFTKKYDALRNENFEDVFGISLIPG